MHLNEQNLGRLPDDAILEKARVEERIVLTHDLDFADLMAASRAELPSVVIFRLSNMTVANVNRYLDLLVQAHAESLERGAIVSVTEKRIRIRTLPIHR
ncbi:MAG: DUF5615 family PIN-like protein [Caldilineaceae bacterium]